MDGNLITICLLTAAINLIGALAYAARIAGVRTKRIAMSFALFNVLILGSRLANGFLGPLLAKRKRDGYLDFQLPEPRVALDEARAPLDIYPGVRLPSHGWVEECMLLANQATAQYLHKHKLPGLYRVHEQPDIEVVQELWSQQAELAARLEAAADEAKQAGGAKKGAKTRKVAKRDADESHESPYSEM